MRLDPLIDVRSKVFRQLPGQQHTGRLSADHPGADHAVMHFEIVFRFEMLLDQDTQTLIPRQHDIAHTAAFLRNVQPAHILDPGTLKKPLPAVHALVDVRSGQVHLPV